MTARVLALGILFSLLFSFSAGAQTSLTDGVLINADSMFRDLEKKTVKLSGHVQVVFRGQHLSCDSANLDLKTSMITAEGHVILNNEKVHVEADNLSFNYKTNLGFLYKGFVQSGQVVFEGDVIQKVDEDRYIATNAEYTACETCPPSWSFSGRKIDAEIGGYARIQRPIFRIGGFPVLILPSLIVPLKSRRQSGFLVPNFDYSKQGGLALTGIYFWAIDRSQDMTLGARWYQLRGYKLLDDYRYVLDPNSKGRMQGAFMQDNQFKSETYSFPPGRNTIDRWYLTYDHYQELPNNFVQRVDFNLASDLAYNRDFPEEQLGQGEPSLENRASITKLGDQYYASAEAEVYTNLLKNYPLSSNDDAVNRFPELKYSFKEQRIGGEWGPLLRVDMDYVNFARQGWNYDNLKACTTPALCPSSFVPVGVGTTGQIVRTGFFDPKTDLMRTGQRLDVQPTVSYPFQIARRFDILPSFSYRETQYHFDPATEAVDGGFSPTAARRYIQADVLAKTEFSKVYGDLNDPKSTRWKHSIEPEVGYSQIPWERTPNHPFFGNYQGLQSLRQYDPLSDADIGNPQTGVQFDYEDRTYERRVTNFVLNNRITRKVWNDGVPDYRTLVLFQVGQSYDFKEANRQYGHPWSSIDSLLDMHFQNFETYTTASYFGYAHHTNFSTRLRGMLTAKNYLQVTYTNTFILDNNYVVTPGSETRNYGLGTGFVGKYFELIAQVDFSDITHAVQDWSYGLNIRPPGRCWVIHVEQVYQLGGNPQTHVALNFDFGGETTSEAATRKQAIE